jgi:hypothetical protein
MRTVLVVAAIGALLTVSCGTIFFGTKIDVSVRSTPACTVTVDGGASYQTPTVVNVKRGDSHTFKFEKEGYKSHTIQVDNKILVGTLIADICLTAIIGVVVDLVDGAMYTMDQKEIEATLQEEGVALTVPEGTDDEVYVVLVDKAQVDAYYASKAETSQ